MNPEINNHFRNEGYYKFSIPNFDNSFFRSEITKIKKTYSRNTQIIEIQDIINTPLWTIQFNPYILEVCNAIFPNFGFINDFNLQMNLVDNSGSLEGWHVDCGSELRDYNGDYLFSDDYSFAKIGVFFQKNSFGMGTGIDVVPKSHKLFRLPRFLYFQFQKFLTAEYLNSVGVTIDVSPGDVVVFDSRLLHRSTPRLPHVSSDLEKFVLYWEVTTPEHSKDFLDNGSKRAAEETSSSFFFKNYLSYTFPKSYPEKYVKTAREKEVAIFSP